MAVQAYIHPVTDRDAAIGTFKKGLKKWDYPMADQDKILRWFAAVTPSADSSASMPKPIPNVD